MNAGAPTCSTCGGVNTSPQASQCRYCGRALATQVYGAPPGYGVHAASTYGAYGGAPRGYDAHGPTAYGAPNPYGGPHVPVAGFGGQPLHHDYIRRGGAWSADLSAAFWLRIVIAVIAVGIPLLGACVSAISR